MCTEHIIPLFILSSMDPAREGPAPPPARDVRTGSAHGRFNGPGARSTRAALGAGRPNRPGARFHFGTTVHVPPPPSDDEISPRNNLFRRLYRILLETRRAARRNGFGNRGPPRGVMRSDAMNCGPPRVCLGSLSKSIKHRGIPCPDVLTNPVSHEKKIGIMVCFFRCRRGEPRGVRTDVPRRGRREYFARRHAAYRPGDVPAPKPPFSLTPTCRRSSPAGAGG